MIMKFNEGEISALKKGFYSFLTGSSLSGLLHRAETRGRLIEKVPSTTAKIRLQLNLENTYINSHKVSL